MIHIEKIPIDADIKIGRHVIHGLDGLKALVEKSALKSYLTPTGINKREHAESPLHVGEVWRPYPRFDSEDEADNRSYQNYIIRTAPISDEEMLRFVNLDYRINDCRVHEQTPEDMLPMVYYEGDGKTMLLATSQKKWKKTIEDRWKAFRKWQIGDCTEAAGQGDKMLGKEFFRGTIDSALPFLSGETIRTLQQLLFRPGYMIREFLRGKHNRTLSPLTAMIVFFAVQVLLTNMVTVGNNSSPTDVYETVIQKMHESEFSPGEEEWGDRFALQIVGVVARIYYVTHLDLYLAEDHTPSEQVLAGVEGWLRSQGVFTFITQLLLLSLSLWVVGRRHYRLTFSAAASIAAYMLCQLCFFNTLGSRQMIPFWLIALLLFENIYQLLGIGYKPTIRYVLKLLLMLLLLMVLGLLLFAGVVSLYAYGKM